MECRLHSPDWAAGSYAGLPVGREFWFDTEGPASWKRNTSSFATTRPLDHSSEGVNNEDVGADNVVHLPPSELHRELSHHGVEPLTAAVAPFLQLWCPVFKERL